MYYRNPWFSFLPAAKLHVRAREYFAAASGAARRSSARMDSLRREAVLSSSSVLRPLDPWQARDLTALASAALSSATLGEVVQRRGFKALMSELRS